MALADLTGRRYGPIQYRLDPEKISDHVEATGADPGQFHSEAPQGFAGTLLFAVAPFLLGDPDLATHNHGVIHGDQSFQWHRPFTFGSTVTVSGEVTKLRERGGVAFLGFSMLVHDDDGPYCDGDSTFVLSGSEAAATGHAERSEPGPDSAPSAGGDDTRWATRRDLIKYAGASRDFNPLHWDHETAVAVGLPGVVVHGLLQTSWLLQAIGPVATAKFRYRAPLLTSVGVSVEIADDGGASRAALTDGSTEYVTATFERLS